MFRIITLLGAVLAFLVLLISSYFRLSAGYTEALIQSISAILRPLGAYTALATTAVPVLLIALSWREKHCRLAAVLTAWLVAALVVGQSVLTFLAVQKQLPLILTGQVLISMTTVWLLFWLYLRVNPAIVQRNTVNTMSNMAMLAMLVLGLETVLGLWLSSHHAGLACQGFPQCNGQLLPEADFIGAFDLSGVISAEALVAIHWLHRAFALITFIVLSLVLFKATAITSTRRVKTAGVWLGVLLFAQLLLSILNIRLGLVFGLSLTHTVLATLLMFPLIAIRFYSRWGFLDVKADVSAIKAKTVVEKAPAPVISKPVAKKSEVPSPVKVEVKAEEEFEDANRYVEPAAESLYLRLKSQLHRTRSGLEVLLTGLPLGQKAIDDDLLEEIEASLLMADIGIDATTAIINRLTQRVERNQLSNSTALLAALKQELLAILKTCDKPLVIPKQDKPFVILVVGVNGAGKTTTIGKLANRLKAQGHSVMLAAGDTFRAAAVEQLQVWGERNHIHVVAQHTGADSASVIYDALQSAQAKGIDVLIADTAGRLQTKSNLMDELKKIKRIMTKLDANAPHEVLLVLDAGTGQNALSQAKLFNEAVELTGLVLTKLDGTAKGGVIFALAKHSGIPIRFIGIGESIEDLQDFHAEQFVDALFVRD
ncbi:MAG: signal recognition particle-docking protein FtsY [Methylococcaceae bacterium]